MIREKIQNTFKIACDDIDLTTITGIEFYVKQLKFFGCYTPRVISPSEMIVTIPFEDAKKLHDGSAKLQFAFTDENGVPGASEPITVPVGELLKEMGYDPIYSKG